MDREKHLELIQGVINRMASNSFQLKGWSVVLVSALFALGGILAQSARVYLTAVVLQLILSAPLASLSEQTGISPMTWSIWLIGLVAVAWTLMGGITTVIWTDVMPRINSVSLPTS